MQELVDNYAAQGKDDPKNKGDDAKDVEQLTADQAMAERLQYEEQRKQRRKEEKEVRHWDSKLIYETVTSRACFTELIARRGSDLRNLLTTTLLPHIFKSAFRR